MKQTSRGKQIEAKPGSMQIDDLFHSANDRTSRFAEAQVLLYRNDPGLQEYFHALDFNLLYRRDHLQERPRPVSPFAAGFFRTADRISRHSKPQKIKTDVLFCPTPYFGRKTEIRFLIRKLLGLAQTGAKILCLLPDNAPFRKELDEQLDRLGRRAQVQFLDPRLPANAVDGGMRTLAAKVRGRAAFQRTVQIIEELGLTPPSAALRGFENTAVYIDAWERLEESIDFEAVVARCHWYDLCSSVCRTGLERGKPVITFQQGVVDYTLDVPIVASRFVTFGSSSASVLGQLNRRFFKAVGSPETPVEFFPSGSLFDLLPSLSDQFARRTVLLVDAYSVPGDPWGTKREVESLLGLAERLLGADLPMQKLVIRPHPHWSDHDLSACLELARRHREKCEISHPVWPLEDDLCRSSAVVGIASGVLTIASASGLPTIFIRREGGLRLEDLQCFSPQQTLFPDAAFVELKKLLSDHQYYSEARQIVMRNASNYYEGGANATLDGAFFSRLLSSPPKIQDRAP